MHLTAIFKLRANSHDQARLRVALARWSAAYSEALDRARSRQKELLHCLVARQTPQGALRLRVNGPATHAFTLTCCQKVPTHLHSSAAMSLIVAVEEQLRSYLGLYADWVKHDRKLPKPAFPSTPPGSDRQAKERWGQALAASLGVATLAEENRWRAEVTRAGRARLLPMYFGAATSGAAPGQAHCGLIQRDDGRLFALLTLWPAEEPLGEPVCRARNRRHAGENRNIRSPARFAPTDRARASLMIPLEFSRGNDPTSSHGRENLFLRRAVPKSAELVERDGDFYLHVAFEFPPVAAQPTPNVLAIRRGIETLLSYVILAEDGALLTQGAIEGRTLRALVTAIRKNRAVRQQQGQLLKGDRRLARVAEHHLFSAAHQIIDLARRHQAEIVLLTNPTARQPTRFLAYRHFHQLAEILGYLAQEAGLPRVPERPIYGSPQTCVQCGWRPGDPVPAEPAGEGCPRCHRPRDPEYDAPHLLALDTLRFRRRDNLVPLAEFIRQRPVDSSEEP